MRYKITEEDRFIIEEALEEDIKTGDITSELTLDDDKIMTGDFLAKDDGIVCGIDIAMYIFKKLDPDAEFHIKKEDAKAIEKGEIFATVTGRIKALLAGERTALNFMQRMGGIATTTSYYVKVISPEKCKLLDTRKTTPLLRRFEKYAVRCGGGHNHRMGLYDMVLVKDNHIAANGGIKETLERLYTHKIDVPVEVEVKNLDELKIALNYPLGRILLDNFSIDTLKEAVNINKGKIPLEASGGIDIVSIKEVCKTGVDFVSSGALTHSFKSLDISFNIHEN